MEKQKKIRLTTPSDIRRCLSWSVNQMIQGKLTPVECGKISYACSVALKCIEIDSMSDFDRRLTEIEEHV